MRSLNAPLFIYPQQQNKANNKEGGDGEDGGALSELFGGNGRFPLPSIKQRNLSSKNAVERGANERGGAAGDGKQAVKFGTLPWRAELAHHRAADRLRHRPGDHRLGCRQ